MRIAVLIPCFNEALTIDSVVCQFKKELPNADIYVYDNNSTDQTAEIAKRAGAIVRYERAQGKGNVVRSMFHDIEADCYVLVDGDNTYPAEQARALIQPILDGYDMSIGDRLSTTYFSENKRKGHNFGNRLVRFVINTFWKRENGAVSDIMTGYRAFSRRFVKSFPVISVGFEIETEMTIHALDKNMAIKNIPILYRDRPQGSYSKLNTIGDGLKILWTIFNLYREYKPFQFFSTFLSSIFLLISLVLFAPVFVDYLETGLVPRTPTLIVSGFSLIVSSQCFVCGMILDGIRRANRKHFEFYLNLLKQSNRL